MCFFGVQQGHGHQEGGDRQEGEEKEVDPAVEEVKKSSRDVSCPRRHLPRHAFCGPELTTRLVAR